MSRRKITVITVINQITARDQHATSVYDGRDYIVIWVLLRHQNMNLFHCEGPWHGKMNCDKHGMVS